MNYRFLGKQKTLSFGAWPDVGLAGARATRDEARQLLATGRDPAEQARLEKAAASSAAANTYKAVAKEWLATATKEGLSDRKSSASGNGLASRDECGGRLIIKTN